MTIEEIKEAINSSWVHQIRAGKKHRFVDISIIETEGRLFVRQYKFKKNSWYYAFLKEPNGAIKIKDQIIPVKAQVPEDLDCLNKKINKAYLKKMKIVYWLMRLTYNRKMHEASTLELIPAQENF
ncbi:MAG: DUF2255 family protein [Marinifilaceae bacterium]|jgi:hypothetical protein|nr:DUF2255 family protein [Marinifilaceae bacterium]